MNVKQWKADQQKKERYIRLRIPEEGSRIGLWRYSPTVYADLNPVRDDDGNYDLLIESTDPECVGLDEVYEHFRLEDMTHEEWRRQFYVDPRYVDPLFVDPGKSRLEFVAEDYDCKVASLSAKERMLFDAASETVPMRALTLALKAKVPDEENSGNVKGCLSVLRKKLGLLRLVKGGYLRNPRPQ